MGAHKPSRAAQVLERFLAKTPAERPAFIETECQGDPELRAEVERLLADLEEADTHYGTDDDLPTISLSPKRTGGDNDPYQLTGTTVAHYRIQERLGKGGMGVVYKAEDTRLHRTVALKFLRLSLNEEEHMRDRFYAEARSASALDHNNVCTVHEFGQTEEGNFYLVMAHYEGQTLLEKIAGMALPLETAVDYGLQIAAGLSAAHAGGILHRDLKPANVMITEASRGAPHGVAKILDFGLAKIEGLELTRTGTTLGTISYMSPEQARGHKLDGRSDIWSLGVILYEMLTGQRPFGGTTQLTALQALASDDPEPPSSLNAEVAGELEAIVLKCLEKDRENRYQEVDDLLADLQAFQMAALSKSYHGGLDPFPRPAPQPERRWLVPGGLLVIGVLLVSLLVTLPASRRALFGSSTPGTAGASRLVAVLPFVNSLEPSPENQALTDGLTHSVTGLIARLGRLESSLWIVPSTEIVRQGVTTASDARRFFGANTVLTGSVQRIGSTTDILISLIDPTLEPPRTVDSRAVAAPLSPALRDQALAGLAGLMGFEGVLDLGLDAAPEATIAASAYTLYLQGRGFLLHSERPGSIDQAVRAFREVVEQDPDYGPAHSGLCEAQWESYRQRNDPELATLAMASCERAAELSVDEAAVLVAVGRSYFEMGEWRRARNELERALELEPDNAEAHRWSAWVAFGAGRLGEAEAAARSAIEARPELSLYYVEYGEMLLNLGHNEEAAAQFERAYELTPENYSTVNMLAVARSQLGQHQEAEELFRQSLELQPNPLAYRNLGYVRFRERRYEEAVENLERASELLGDTPYFNDWIVWDWLAHAYYWAGDRTAAEATWRRLIEVATALYEVNPRESNVLMFLSDAHAALGELDRARFYLSRLAATPSDTNYVNYWVGRAYEIMGDRELALDYVARALEERFDPLMVDSDPWLEDLRREPEYKALRQQYMPSGD